MRSRRVAQLVAPAADFLGVVRSHATFQAAMQGDSQAAAETARADAESARANAETARANAETARADAESARANAEKERADRLEADLRARKG